MKPAALALLLAAGVSAGALGLWTGARLTMPTSSATIGAPAAAIALPSLDGQIHTLAALGAGRPLLVNFWASWCGPCIEEMPLLDTFAAAQGDDGIQVVGIALDEHAAVQAFLRTAPVRYRILLDTAGPADSSVRLGNIRGVLPYSVLIDAQGRIAATKIGPFRGAELARFAAP